MNLFATGLVFKMMMLFMLLLPLFISTSIAADGSSPDAPYCKFTPNHTMCKYRGVHKKCGGQIPVRGVSQEDIRLILNEHNAYRSKIAMGKESRGKSAPQQPPAANMLVMQWDPELARIAQRHADQCTFDHDCGKCRKSDRFEVGQNLFITFGPYNEKAEWSRAIGSWYDEVADWDPKHNKPFVFSSPLGHYTQMAWWSTRLIGCGLTMFQEDGWWKKLYTCNYGPTGNVIGREMYKTGQPCSQCPHGSSCSSYHPGLCEVNKNAISRRGRYHTDNGVKLSFEDFDYLQKSGAKPKVKANPQTLNLIPNSNLPQNSMHQVINKIHEKSHNPKGPHTINVNLKHSDATSGKQSSPNLVLRPNGPGLITVHNMHQTTAPIRKLQNIPSSMLKMLSSFLNLQPQTIPQSQETGPESSRKRPQIVSIARMAPEIISSVPVQNPYTPNGQKNLLQIASRVSPLPLNTQMVSRGERSKLIVDQNGKVLEVIEFGPNVAHISTSQHIPSRRENIKQQISNQQNPIDREIKPQLFEEGILISNQRPSTIAQPPSQISQVQSSIPEKSFSNDKSTIRTGSETIATKPTPPSPLNLIETSSKSNEAVTIPAAVMQLLPQHIQSTIKRLKNLFEKGPTTSLTNNSSMVAPNPTTTMNQDIDTGLTPKVLQEFEPKSDGGNVASRAAPLKSNEMHTTSLRSITNVPSSENQLKVNVEEAITAIEKGTNLPNSQVLRTTSVSDLKRILQSVPEGVEPLVLYKSSKGDLVQINPQTLNPVN